MKYVYGFGIIALAILLVVRLDACIIFLLSGFVPGINVTLSPSMMMAVMIAGAVVIPLLGYRQTIYHACLSLYDALFGFGKKGTVTPEEPAIETPSSLPRRRYQQL